MSRNRCGMTMLELLVAVFILGIAVVPIFDLLTRGAVQARVSREETLAVVANAELVDQIQCMPFADLRVKPGEETRQLGNSDNGKCLVGNGETPETGNPSTVLFLSPVPDDFTRTVTIMPISDYLKKITVSVKWGGDTAHEVTYSVFMEYSP